MRYYIIFHTIWCNYIDCQYQRWFQNIIRSYDMSANNEYRSSPGFDHFIHYDCCCKPLIWQTIIHRLMCVILSDDIKTCHLISMYRYNNTCCNINANVNHDNWKQTCHNNSLQHCECNFAIYVGDFLENTILLDL